MDKITILKEKVKEADMVLIGIGEEFSEKFDKIAAYPQIMRILDETDEDETKQWLIPYLEKLYLEEEKHKQEAYQKLYELVKDKNYFLVTTCIDGYVEAAGFQPEKLVEPCGNYQRLQCIEGCNKQLYDADTYVTNLKQAIEQGELEQWKQPVCPDCGKPLVFNHILCEHYLEEGYLPQWEQYTKWLQNSLNKKICILELGVGMHLPNTIRWPFEKIAFYNKKASFFRINKTLYQMTEDLGDKGISIEGNALEILSSML